MRTSRNKKEEEKKKKRKTRDALHKCYASHRIKNPFLLNESFVLRNFDGIMKLNGKQGTQL